MTITFGDIVESRRVCQLYTKDLQHTYIKMPYVENVTNHQQQLMIMPAKQKLMIMPTCPYMQSPECIKNAQQLHSQDGCMNYYVHALPRTSKVPSKSLLLFGQRTDVKYYMNAASADDYVNYYMDPRPRISKYVDIDSMQKKSYFGERPGADYFLKAPPSTINMNLRGWNYFNTCSGMIY